MKKLFKVYEITCFWDSYAQCNRDALEVVATVATEEEAIEFISLQKPGAYEMLTILPIWE